MLSNYSLLDHCTPLANVYLYGHSDRIVTIQSQLPAIWSEAEYNEFIAWIAANTKAGDVIKGSGGVRKVRWASSGHGKRGGARIIFYSADTSYIYLMTIYAKNQRADISAKDLKVIKELIE